jgi:hypothetical protein
MCRCLQAFLEIGIGAFWPGQSHGKTNYKSQQHNAYYEPLVAEIAPPLKFPISLGEDGMCLYDFIVHEFG